MMCCNQIRVDIGSHLFRFGLYIRARISIDNDGIFAMNFFKARVISWVSCGTTDPMMILSMFSGSILWV